MFNEQGSIETLFNEILKVCVQNKYSFEIIFVDDGSYDNTREVLLTKCAPIKYIRLRRNFGQTAAMDAGIKASKYEYIVTMDGDGQNDPADIPKLITYLEENNLDVVSGWRRHRKDNFFKKIASRCANLLRRIIVRDHIHDSGCSLKVYRKICFENINLYGEMHRFIPGLLRIKGFKVGEIVVNHRPRKSGKTKYTWKRSIKGLLDMITVWFWHKYAVRPFHLLGSFGILSLTIGAFFGVWTVILFISGQSLTNNFHPMVAIAFLIVGLLLFVFGLMSDMLTRIYFGSKIDMPYSIKEVAEVAQVDKEL
ncbi:MAG: glycosyltransferase family 2 protein [Oscillospiraceae bacterium]|nr:glycosyltransferase family 2 protein [Oscillospiraceae bacterium]